MLTSRARAYPMTMRRTSAARRRRFDSLSSNAAGAKWVDDAEIAGDVSDGGVDGGEVGDVVVDAVASVDDMLRVACLSAYHNAISEQHVCALTHTHTPPVPTHVAISATIRPRPPLVLAQQPAVTLSVWVVLSLLW
jgi:hypothetical protein